MRILEDYKIYKTSIKKNFNGNYTFSIENGDSFIFKGSSESLVSFMKQIKAKDTISTPKSNRKITYRSMVDELEQNECLDIYLFKHKIKNFKGQKNEKLMMGNSFNYPSNYKIGQRVKFKIPHENIETENAFIRCVIFSNMKVRYSVFLSEAETTLHNIDSIWITDIGRELTNIDWIDFGSDNYS